MSFVESITTVFKKYAVFEGRARRSEYWWFILAYVIVSGIFSGLFTALAGTAGQTIITSISGLVGLACLVPNIAVTTRRLHDTGRSGWWQLISLTCIGWIIILVWTAMDSTPGANKYGENPKGE